MTPQEAITYNLVAHNRKCRGNPTIALFLAFAGTRLELSQPRLQDMSHSKMEAELSLRLMDALPYPFPNDAFRLQLAAMPGGVSPASIARVANLIIDANSVVQSAQLEALESTNSIDIKSLPDFPSDFIFSSRHQFAFMHEPEEDSAWNDAREVIMRKMSSVRLATVHLQHYTPAEIAFHLKTIATAQPLVNGMQPNKEGLRFKYLQLIEAALVNELGVFGQMDYKQGVFSVDRTEVKLDFNFKFVGDGDTISLERETRSGLQRNMSLRKLCQEYVV